MVLSVKDSPPEEMRDKVDQLVDILQEQSGLVVGVHQVLPMLYVDSNGTCCLEDPSSSDVWFYAIDPTTQTIIPIDSPLMKEHVTNKQAQTSLKYIVTGDLHVQASELRAPHLPMPRTTPPTITTTKINFASVQYNGYPAVLIAIGCFVFLMSFIAIIYMCVIYTKMKNAHNKSERMVVIPRYEPVYVEPKIKTYETQVLQMAVSLDDADSADLKLDFSNRSHMFNPSFNLDNVSYITHETSASSSPVSDSELLTPPSHSTFRPATITSRPVVRNTSNRSSDSVALNRSRDQHFPDYHNRHGS